MPFMLAERATLTTLLLSTAVAGCSFYQFQSKRYVRQYEQAGLHEYRASLKHGEVHYWAGGQPDGRPLLLIHGFGADAMWGWVGQLPLARDRFLIVPDLLWFGGSHGSQDDFSATWQAAMVLELLDHLAVDKIDVVGISYGGFVTMELAVAQPERVNRIVLVDSPGPTYTLDDYHAMLARQHLDSVAQLVVPDDARGVQRLVRLAYHRPPPVPMFVARDIFANMFSSYSEQKIRLLDHLLARAGTVEAEQWHIGNQVMVLWGQYDELFPVPLAHRLAAALGSNAQVHIIPNSNHAPNIERPNYFNRQVLSFVGTR